MPKTALRSQWTRPTTARDHELALVALGAGMFLLFLDSVLVNVLSRPILADLNLSQSNPGWVAGAFAIPFAGLLLLAAHLVDRIGRRSIFVSGAALFTLGSLVGGLAQGQEMMTGARVGQGIGAALAFAALLSLVATKFLKRRPRAWASGIYAFVVAAGMAVASGAAVVPLAGVVPDLSLDWRWSFLAAVPVGVGLVLLALRLLDDTRETDAPKRLDVAGAVLITGSLTLGMYASLQAIESGWGSTRTLEFGGIAVALLVAFVGWQARARNPLVGFKVFGTRNVAAANAIQLLTVAGTAATFFFSALYMSQIERVGLAGIGLAFVPYVTVIGVMCLAVTPWLVRKVDAKGVVLGGLASLAAGAVLLARVPVDGRYVIDVVPAMVLVSLGVGLCLPAVMILALAGTTGGDVARRTGLVNSTLLLGPVLGLAVLTAVSNSRATATLASGRLGPAALTSGYRLALLIGAGLVLVALVLSLTVLRRAVARTAPAALDATVTGSGGHTDDATGVLNPDFLALGLGATNMMAMLWSVAMGKRAVGVELRGDPSLGVHWNIREDFYHHISLIDKLMMQRYGEEGVPRRGDGKIFSLSECFYHPGTAAGAVDTDEVVSGFLDSLMGEPAHIGGIIFHTEFIDDRWKDGAPNRVITVVNSAIPPTEFDPTKVGRKIFDVLDGPSTFQCGAAEVMVLLRRYLEEIERMDLARGVEPRVRLFLSHRVVAPDTRDEDGHFRWFRPEEGFITRPDGRKAIRIEPVRELDYRGKFRRVRIPGTETIDIGVPELFMIAQGFYSSDAERLGFQQEDVEVDHHDGRGPVVAQADYLAGLLEILVDGRLRRRIASEFDTKGNEYWVRQIAVGHQEDPEVGWILVQVPDFKTFDPILAGLVPAGTGRKEKKYVAAVQHLMRDFYLEQVSLITEISRAELEEIQMPYGPKLFSLVEKAGVDAQVAVNGVVAGDSFGNGHFLTSGGAITGMIGHGCRVYRYWQDRESGVGPEVAIRTLAEGIKEDTDGWLQVSAQEFSQAVPINFGAERIAQIEKATGMSSSARATTIDATRRHRHALVPLDPSDWRRLVVQSGRLQAISLPPLNETHPMMRDDSPSADAMAMAGDSMMAMPEQPMAMAEPTMGMPEQTMAMPEESMAMAEQTMAMPEQTMAMPEESMAMESATVGGDA